MKRKSKPEAYAPRPCDCCETPVPVEAPGYVMLGDKRLICKRCYESSAHHGVMTKTTQPRLL